MTGYEKIYRLFGVCPLESGMMGQLADHECEHGRLPGDSTEPCGCWGPERTRGVPGSPIRVPEVVA